ncbi:MAG TPA: hypothetical protein VNJ02_06335 [Vicinamibacterales bacterium]|nr:hypothetical protein [Vicinamibacterales bacterium]
MIRAAAIAALLAAAIAVQVWRDRGWTAYEPATPVMWLRAGPAIKKMSLGFDPLLADIYWMRTVIYFGQQRLSKVADKNYDLLYPLLELVTTLDPRFTVAYRFGAVFLSESLPDGPGRPDQAVALLQRGIAASPERWEYYHSVGFTYYWSYRDTAAAGEWLEKAAAVPHAPLWLRSTAALMRQEAGDRQAARILWVQLAESADNASLTALARSRVSQFDAMDAIDALNEAVWRFEARMGRPARGWNELIQYGVLRRVPTDPAGVPFVFDTFNEDVRLSEKSPLFPLPTGLETQPVKPPS